MKHFVALVSGCGWHVQDLARASQKLNVRFSPLDFASLVGSVGGQGAKVMASGVDLMAADGVAVRMMPSAGLEPVVFRMDALHRVERSGVPVLNPARSIETSVDKYLSLSLIEQTGLPVPATFTCEQARDAMSAFESLGEDVVVKPLFGSEGRGLVRIREVEVARRVFQILEQLGSVLYVQKMIRNPGYDYRVFVLGDRALGAMRRHGQAGDWRTNVAIGGRPEPCALAPGLEQLAVRAAKAVSAIAAGVDLMDDLDRGSPVVLEVNAVPGWKALSAVTGVDVACQFLEHLRDMR